MQYYDNHILGSHWEMDHKERQTKVKEFIDPTCVVAQGLRTWLAVGDEKELEVVFGDDLRWLRKYVPQHAKPVSLAGGRVREVYKALLQAREKELGLRIRMDPLRAEAKAWDHAKSNLVIVNKTLDWAVRQHWVLWRNCQNERLRRQVQEDKKCAACAIATENKAHVMWSCKRLQKLLHRVSKSTGLKIDYRRWGLLKEEKEPSDPLWDKVTMIVAPLHYLYANFGTTWDDSKIIHRWKKLMVREVRRECTKKGVDATQNKWYQIMIVTKQRVEWRYENKV